MSFLLQILLCGGEFANKGKQSNKAGPDCYVFPPLLQLTFFFFGKQDFNYSLPIDTNTVH